MEEIIYLVIIYHELNYGHSNIQMVDFAISKEANTLISGQVRTTGDSGGGCFALGVISCPANVDIVGRCYVYSASSNGKAVIKTFAIKMESMLLEWKYLLKMNMLSIY